MSNLIELNHISKTFNEVQALKDINFSIKPGEVRCIAGENGCGKSTLVKIISGVYQPDQSSGSILINGNVYDKLDPRSAISEGIQVIYQDLSLFEHMTVQENISMNAMVFEGGLLHSKSSEHDIAVKQLQKLNISLDLNIPVRNLSMANKQLVAICRALALNAKVIFMDEPTTALTKPEIDSLVDVVKMLKSNNISVVFISHKLDEIFRISDSITVIRDGVKIGDFQASDLDERKLAYYMTGRDVVYSNYERTLESKEVLNVKNLTKKDMYEDINFSIDKGEIVGLIGLLGSGRTEIALSLFGLNQADSGSIFIDGEEVTIKTPQDAISSGIALLSEDRSTQGLYMQESQRVNITAPILSKKIGKKGFINFKEELELSTNINKNVGVNNKDIEIHVGKLSGGNQQKVVLGKWLATNPKILILDTPTVGVDIGSKAEIYDRIQSEAKKGMGVLLISDEIDEIIPNSNTIYVISNGKIIHKLSEMDLKQEDIRKKISLLISGEDKGGKQ